MQVSIIILNYNHPHNINRLLPSLQMIEGVEYEVVVVDNGSTVDVVDILKQHESQGQIDRLVLNETNQYFSEGCNIGVRNSDPSSEFILLLNSDTEILNGDLLSRMVDWANGIPKTAHPGGHQGWAPTHSTQPTDQQRGIISVDWSYDLDVPGHVRPEGWCCLIRREAWRDMSDDFPMNFGDLEMFASIIRDGYACGCLCRYANYIKHHHSGGAPTRDPEYIKKMGLLHTRNRLPKMKEWWEGLSCESLDFTLGEHQHNSYLDW